MNIRRTHLYFIMLVAMSAHSIAAFSTENARTVRLENRIDTLLAEMTLEEKIRMVHADSKFTTGAVERLGIHELVLSDGPHGVRHEINRQNWDSAQFESDHSTYLPPLTSVAASWDPAMATLHGFVLGAEARHRGKDFILGPGVNLARLPLYGRNFEYMGEDPFLAAALVVPQVQAIQANDVAATVKHYALNTQELNRIGVDAKPDERTLREVYLPAFEAAVKQGGALAIMGAYNNYYGTNANQSKHLVKDILKGEWGFEGVLLTDWNVNINTFDAAINGLDIEMGTAVDSYDDYYLAKPLQEAIEKQQIPVAVLDDKVRRILRVQHKIGMMDKYRQSGRRNTQEHKNSALTIAENGIVLLKNQQAVLPWQSSKFKEVLVLGPNADKVHGNGGGSSEVKSLYEITPLQGLKNALPSSVKITHMRAKAPGLSPIAADYIKTRHWTGTPAWNIRFYDDRAFTQLSDESWVVNSEYSNTDATIKHIAMNADVMPLHSGKHEISVASKGDFSLSIDGKTIIKEGQKSATITLQANTRYRFDIEYHGSDSFVLGWNAPGQLFNTEQEYLSAAKRADAVVYFAGLSHADDREAIDRSSMKLPNNQDDIISQLLAVNPNTTVFVIAGSAVEMPWAAQAKSIVWGWYGGQEAGNAYANMLLGKVNPSGKMPITLPKKLTDTAPIMLNDYNATESLYKEGVFIGYRWYEKHNIETEFPFGHGLSYTRFNYSNANVKQLDDERFEVSVQVTNTGKLAGAEVVQLYLEDVKASVERPQKELKGFQKLQLKAGETQTAKILLTKRDLSFWDEKSNNWLAEKGEFKVHLGSSVQDIRRVTTFNY